VSETFNVTTREQTKFIDEQSKKILSSTGNILSGAMGSVSSIFLFFGLLPIYIYLFLFYKNLFLKFIFMWFTDESHPKVKESLKETEVIIKSYLIGLLRSEEHTSELQSRENLVCRLLLEKNNTL